MNNFIKRAYNYAVGRVPVGVIVERDLEKIIEEIKRNGYGLADKYCQKIYNIVEIGIPNDKHQILRRGIEEIMETLVDSINLHVIMELDKINDKLKNESTK